MISRILLVSMLIFLSSCTKTETSGRTWTVHTGVSVVEVKPCDETPGRDELTVSKQGSNYLVDVNETFSCEADLSSPWLTTIRQHKATLVLVSGTKGSSCECRRKVRIRIAERLEAGDSLYVLNENEVVGHFVLP